MAPSQSVLSSVSASFSGTGKEAHIRSLDFGEKIIEEQCHCFSSTRERRVEQQNEKRHLRHSHPSPAMVAGLSVHIHLSNGLQITS